MRVPNEEGKYGKLDADSEALFLKLDADSEALFLKHPGAQAAVVIVVGPPEVSGFSVSSPDMQIVKTLPALLRDVAASIEKQLQQTQGN